MGNHVAQIMCKLKHPNQNQFTYCDSASNVDENGAKLIQHNIFSSVVRHDRRYTN